MLLFVLVGCGGVAAGVGVDVVVFVIVFPIQFALLLEMWNISGV